MIHSTVAADPTATVHVLHGDDVSPRARSRATSMVGDLGGEIAWHRVEHGRLGDLPDGHPAPASAWYRLLLPEILDSFERVVYIDGDAIVCEPLGALWDLELGDASIGAVTNVLQDDVHERHLLDIGIRDPHRYFNSC